MRVGAAAHLQIVELCLFLIYEQRLLVKYTKGKLGNEQSHEADPWDRWGSYGTESNLHRSYWISVPKLQEVNQNTQTEPCKAVPQ